MKNSTTTFLLISILVIEIVLALNFPLASKPIDCSIQDTTRQAVSEGLESVTKQTKELLDIKKSLNEKAIDVIKEIDKSKLKNDKKRQIQLTDFLIIVQEATEAKK